MAMCLFLLFTLPFALATPPQLQARQQPSLSLNGSTITSGPAFSSAAAQLVGQYFPSSLLPSFAIAVQSAADEASMTGNINSLVSSVLTATSLPDFLTAVPLPSQYSSRLGLIESQLNLIQSQAESATARHTSTLVAAGGGNGTNGTMGNGSTSGMMGGALTTAASDDDAVSATGDGSAATTSAMDGFAAATKVPLAFAAAGVMGLVGMAAVL
ncbi:MAG: hypothetical protein Q9174_004491 [Haloplaca sp. 1 TL-2023]